MTDPTPSPDATRQERDPLDALLDRASYRPPADLDVEGALRKVHARMDEPVVHSLVAQRESGQPAKRAFGRNAAGLAAAAAIVATVGLGVLRDKAATDADSVEPRTIATTTSSDSVNLADGTRVLIGPASELTIGAGYGAHRSVQLRGDAHFSVKHDSANPFEVRAGGAVITDLGTEFDVHSGPDGVAVAVKSGSVKLSGDANAKGLVLNAGDRTLRNASVALARAELQRWYGLNISLADSALASRHLTASFSAESARQVLDIITLALGARYEIHGDGVVLRASSPASPH